MKTSDQLFDVVAVNLKDNTVRFFGEGETYQNADAIVKMAVMRRGLDEEFYAVVAAGSYKEGDKWHGGVAKDPNPRDPEDTIQLIGGTYYPIGPRGLDR